MWRCVSHVIITCKLKESFLNLQPSRIWNGSRSLAGLYVCTFSQLSSGFRLWANYDINSYDENTRFINLLNSLHHMELGKIKFFYVRLLLTTSEVAWFTLFDTLLRIKMYKLKRNENLSIWCEKTQRLPFIWGLAVQNCGCRW